MARINARPATRPVVHYYPIPNPATTLAPIAPADVAEYRRYVAELAQRRRNDRVLYARWVRRQAEIAERDRRNRRIALGIAIPLTCGGLATLGTLAWLLWHAMTGLGPAIILLVLAGAALGSGVAHRCVTVVQHWH